MISDCSSNDPMQNNDFNPLIVFCIRIKSSTLDHIMIHEASCKCNNKVECTKMFGWVMIVGVIYPIGVYYVCSWMHVFDVRTLTKFQTEVGTQYDK